MDIINRVHEDDESQLKLSKEYGKIHYCLNKYYPESFDSLKQDLGQYFLKLINKDDDY